MLVLAVTIVCEVNFFIHLALILSGIIIAVLVYFVPPKGSHYRSSGGIQRLDGSLAIAAAATAMTL
jgi:hypothetical protein